MGGKSAKTIQSNFYSADDINILQAKFQSLSTNRNIFDLEGHSDFGPKILKYIEKFTGPKKDFKAFVGICEYLVFGKSSQLVIPEKSSIEILAEILQISPDSAHKELPVILLKLCQGDSIILEHVNPPKGSIRDIRNYLELSFPLLSSSFERFMRNRLINASLPVPTIIPLEDRNIAKVLPLLYYSCYNLTQVPQVHQIFLSDIDGLSFNRLAAAITGYQGPMIMVIKLYGGILLGAYIGLQLQDNAQISGSMDTFLFTLSKGFKTFKSSVSASNGKFIYFNSKLNNSTKFPKGLGFGGDKEESRLWIDGDLEDYSYVSESCGTYETGKLVEEPGNKVKMIIVNIEIWGCGGESALERQMKIKKGEETRISNARKVDKSQLANNQFNREFLLSGTFQNSEYKDKE
ncbi:hypothetical protein SteCoe_10127 [Stentor coeruleus]|uniref:TLDc domain-containing protein n=1 Tax=Stentor coeruleus TaxID=5963 RepID=A0A1R2CGC6_9CILI|nr:hypothetical protein SteCoe_10127 [Stentor coeruleus]